MRVYYRGRDVVVTSELFVRRTMPARSFAIREMRNVCIARDAGIGSKTVLAAAAGAFGVAAVGVVLATGSYDVLPVIVIAAAVAATAMLIRRRRPVRWELQADYQGRPVTLYSSTDPTGFNQVSRALRRAIEAGRRAPEIPYYDAA
jgi:hypothetical protein